MKHQRENSKNTTSISVGYVDPQRKSNTEVGPGWYSLGNKSNVPFIRLTSSGGFSKTITWGEIVEVPHGQLVSVTNDSYHGGDIFLNKGRDYCNRPSRITVPVEFKLTRGLLLENGDTVDLFGTIFPCDTRGAKRAYLTLDAQVAALVPGESVQMLTRGRRLQGSHKTQNLLTQLIPPLGPGVGYLTIQDYGPFEQLSSIPLGQGASQTAADTLPHTLLDAADAFFILEPPGGALISYFNYPANSAELLRFIELGLAPVEYAFMKWYTIEYE